MKRSLDANANSVRESLAKSKLALNDFANLISPAASELLEQISVRSQQLTQQRFGKVIRLFAPLYVSNECINNCSYCGFSRDNAILRVTLSIEEVLREARELKQQGFRNILLVAGEHPKFISNNYLRNCVAALHAEIPSVSLEVGPGWKRTNTGPSSRRARTDSSFIRKLMTARFTTKCTPPGRNVILTGGSKPAGRAYAAGFRRLGISALYGLADWRYEAICVAAHADFLLRHCWKAQVTISLPRLRPCAGEFQPLTHMTDRELVQLVCAFRLMFPDAGLVLSTREPARLRDGLIPLGITLMSAGSHTEPGGYTGAGKEKIHHTVRGKIVELGASEWAVGTARRAIRSSQRDDPTIHQLTNATGQFEISDDRSPGEVAELIRKLGYEPVWKDWDAALTT